MARPFFDWAKIGCGWPNQTGFSPTLDNLVQVTVKVTVKVMVRVTVRVTFKVTVKVMVKVTFKVTVSVMRYIICNPASNAYKIL